MPRLILIGMVLGICGSASAQVAMCTIDRDTGLVPWHLIDLTSDPADTQVSDIGGISDFSSTSFETACMDFGPDDRLFVARDEGVVYEIDLTSGNTISSLEVSPFPIEGLAVSDGGLIYASIEVTQEILEIDFDNNVVSTLVSHGMEIDDMDFDDAGSLIGQDLNRSGNMYNIPLDGSLPQVIANIPAAETPFMSFSDVEKAFYFKITYTIEEGSALYRIPWHNGLPAGPMEFVKYIGSGKYVGLALLDGCIGPNIAYASDSDGDAIPDPCDICPNLFNPTQQFFSADCDHDCDVDGVDFSFFASCFNGSGNPPRTLGCPPDHADLFDFFDDGDVDGLDFAIFASCYNGAGVSPRTDNCIP